MGVKAFFTDFSKISTDAYLRKDEKFHVFLNSSDWNLFNSKSKKLIPLKDILLDDYNNFIYEEGEEYKGIPTGQTYIDEEGEIIEFLPVTADEHPSRLKYKASNQNILISSLRLAKSPALYYETMDLSRFVFSNGFYIFKVDTEWDKRFVLYILRTKRLKNLLDNHIYRGIGISAYKAEDLLEMKIPIVSLELQKKTVKEILPIEDKIAKLKQSIKKPQSIANEVLCSHFKFDIDAAYTIEHNKMLEIPMDISYRNPQLRSSYRWQKIRPIQDILFANNPYIEKLGKHLISTKNGWSPHCTETDTEYFVFGVNAISKNGYIRFEDLKTSSQEKTNLVEYFVQENDLYVSRGNTVDLVALASVVKNLPDDKNIVYPDLFIKLEVKKSINKEYLAHLFNSIIGRLYFKYAAKGKNQTMVKVSADEINNFYLPIPPLDFQQKIVDEIKEELDKQEEIKQQIAAERAKIDAIIEKAVA